ncbi:hypothetical protein IMCC12053_374 [Celeribacter marinus]|uniref:Uncharacterized protein n=1 Tax=Celeribacter marinus TaxID=1397108 RepID=A0A0P0A7G4_9RHOB|nr:hypothetical protein IMCC12053_374 [Celeribacter marinus]
MVGVVGIKSINNKLGMFTVFSKDDGLAKTITTVDLNAVAPLSGRRAAQTGRTA